MKPAACVIGNDNPAISIIIDLLRTRGYQVEYYEDPTISPISSPDIDAQNGDDRYQLHILISNLEIHILNAVESVELLRVSGIQMKNVALIYKILDEKAVRRAKENNIKLFRKPFSLLQLSDWLDECEGRTPFWEKFQRLNGNNSAEHDYVRTTPNPGLQDNLQPDP